MHKLLTATKLLAALAVLACDSTLAREESTNDIVPRLWTPEEIEIVASIDEAREAGGVLDCLAAQPLPAVVEYSAGKTDDDDRKPLVITLSTEGHEDIDLCIRELLLGKLGGEVQP